MFVMVFVVEPITIFCVCFFYSGIVYMTSMRDPPPPLTSAPSKITSA